MSDKTAVMQKKYERLYNKWDYKYYFLKKIKDPNNWWTQLVLQKQQEVTKGKLPNNIYFLVNNYLWDFSFVLISLLYLLTIFFFTTKKRFEKWYGKGSHEQLYMAKIVLSWMYLWYFLWWDLFLYGFMLWWIYYFSIDHIKYLISYLKYLNAMSWINVDVKWLMDWQVFTKVQEEKRKILTATDKDILWYSENAIIWKEWEVLWILFLRIMSIFLERVWIILLIIVWILSFIWLIYLLFILKEIYNYWLIEYMVKG